MSQSDLLKKKEFYLDRESIAQALNPQGMFYEVQYPQLDMEYLAAWVRRLNLDALFHQLIAEAKIIL